MRSKPLLFVALLLVLLQCLVVYGQKTSEIKGVVFADYNYHLKSHKFGGQDRNAFSIRRIYFTFENNITAGMKMRFRLESAHGKYGATSKIHPFVKHAYLEWKNLIPRHKLYLGIAETNAFKNSEKYWGYRSVEKTIMDLNKISSSADMGIALKGDLFGDMAHHWLTIFNGTGYGSSEVDRYKKIGYAFWMTPIAGLMIEGYADYENQDPDAPQTATVFKQARDYNGSSEYYTVKGFLGYKHPRFTFGAEAFIRTNQESGIKDVTIADNAVAGYSKADVKRLGFSIFGSLITPVPKLKAFSRYDYYDPNTRDDVYTRFADGQLTGGADDEYRLIIVGLDYIPQPDVHIMPYIMVKQYSQGSKERDLMARITLYYKFNSGKIKVK